MLFGRPSEGAVSATSGSSCGFCMDGLATGAVAANPDFECWCVWVEDRVRKAGVFRLSHLQTVYADGSPRNYDEEK
jgi:hypothetical protein